MCKDLGVGQHGSWGGCRDGPGCAGTLRATGKRVDFFFPLNVIWSMRSTPLYKDCELLQKPCPGHAVWRKLPLMKGESENVRAGFCLGHQTPWPHPPRGWGSAE